jgi:hypothetical protein
MGEENTSKVLRGDGGGKDGVGKLRGQRSSQAQTRCSHPPAVTPYAMDILVYTPAEVAHW